jgi:hypothetical protein
VGVTLDKGKRIITGENFKTVVPNIFAIGDAISGPMLAHKVHFRPHARPQGASFQAPCWGLGSGVWGRPQGPDRPLFISASLTCEIDQVKETASPFLVRTWSRDA